VFLNEQCKYLLYIVGTKVLSIIFVTPCPNYCVEKAVRHIWTKSEVIKSAITFKTQHQQWARFRDDSLGQYRGHCRVNQPVTNKLWPNNYYYYYVDLCSNCCKKNRCSALIWIRNKTICYSDINNLTHVPLGEKI